MMNYKTSKVSDSEAKAPLRFVIRYCVIRYLLAALAAFFLTFVFFFAAGNSLDLFIAGVFVSALLLPPCSAIAGQSPGGWFVPTLSSFAIGLVWLAPVHAGLVSLSQWLMCLAILITFGFLLWSMVGLMVQLKMPELAASAVVTVVALAWLTWPIWLSPSLSGGSVRWLIYLHPLMAINHIVSQLGIWPELQGAYTLTTLGQDLQYQLPSSAWPTIGLQPGLALVMSLISRLLTHRRAMSSRGASPANR